MSQIINVKIGTVPYGQVLLMKGKVAVGERVEWIEDRHSDGKFIRWGNRQMGIVRRINDDGRVFIDRF